MDDLSRGKKDGLLTNITILLAGRVQWCTCGVG